MTQGTTSAVAHLQAIKDAIPESNEERRIIAKAARDLLRAVEPLTDQTHQLLYSNLVLPVARIAVDLHLFETLAKNSSKHFTTSELAGSTGADVVLLTRILRFLSAHHLIEEPAIGTWSCSAWTKYLTSEGNLNSILHQFENCGPAYNSAPGFLAGTSYRNVDDGSNCAFQAAHKTKQGLFEWFGAHPNNLDYFMKMLPQHQQERTWIDTDLVQVLSAKSANEDTIVFVDVGGNVGDVCVNLRKQLPELKGRVINQDLPHVVDKTIAYPGVETSAHDFWTPQVIKDAKVYYMRHIMHDWPDDKCCQILKNIASAMSADSQVWIDEVVMADQGASEVQVDYDWTMLTMVAGMERSRSQWTKLLDDAGFIITDVHVIEVERGSAVIVAAQK